MQSKYLKRALTLAIGASLFAPLTQAYEYDSKTSSIIVRSVDDFGKCAQESGSSQECLDGLQRYVDKTPKDALPAAKRVRREYRHFAALPFFDKALQQKGATGICTDEDLRLALTSGLELPTDYPQTQIAKKIAQDSCWKELQTQIQSDLKTAGGYYTTNTCPILKAKGVAAPECEAKQAVTETKGLTPEMQAVKALNWKEVKLDSKGTKAFSGSENEQVFMVRAAAPNDSLYVVKLKSIRGAWNNRVFVARERAGGADGKDYVTVVNDREWVLMTSRSGYYGGGGFEVYPEGYANGVRLSEVDLGGQSRKLKADDVVKEFK